MKRSEIVARHYLLHQEVRLRWLDGVITSCDPLPEEEGSVWWVAPGLFDVQVNGFGGVDFQSDGVQTADLLTAARALRAAGCTRFLLALMTDRWDLMLARLQRLKASREESDELKASIAGWHIEGPFLSSQKGYHGAHDPALMVDPTPEHLKQLKVVTGPDPVILTVAPERKGAAEFIAQATKLGFKVSLGHTDASTEQLAAAVAAGASGFTHLGNACPQLLDRHDNILWRAVETPRLTVSLVPDKIHVSPSLFRLFHRVLPLDDVIYTTDAMAAAGAPPGRYRLGAMEVEVGADQVVRQPGKTNFAGSALRPIDGVFRAAEMVGIPWQETWRHFSLAPAEWMGLAGTIGVGHAADFCLVKVTSEGHLTDLRVFFQGKEQSGI